MRLKSLFFQPSKSSAVDLIRMNFGFKVWSERLAQDLYATCLVYGAVCTVATHLKKKVKNYLIDPSVS